MFYSQFLYTLVHTLFRGGMSKLNLVNKRRFALIIASLVGLNGVGNIALGVWSFLEIDSLNITDRVTALNSMIDSLDPSLVAAPTLRDQLLTLKTAVVEEFNVFLAHNQNFNVIPAFLIFQGIIFVAISLAIYLIIPEKESAHA